MKQILAVRQNDVEREFEVIDGLVHIKSALDILGVKYAPINFARERKGSVVYKSCNRPGRPLAFMSTEDFCARLRDIHRNKRVWGVLRFYLDGKEIS